MRPQDLLDLLLQVRMLIDVFISYQRIRRVGLWSFHSTIVMNCSEEGQHGRIFSHQRRCEYIFVLLNEAMRTLLLWFSHGEQKDLEIWITKDHRVKESWIKKNVVDPLDVSSLASASRNWRFWNCYKQII